MIATVKHLNIYDARTHALDRCSLMISEIADYEAEMKIYYK